MRGSEALERLLLYSDIQTVIDVGSGSGMQASLIRESGRRVTTVSLMPPADHVASFESLDLGKSYDAIWMCHVLEHTLNPHSFLQKAFRVLRDQGVLAVTVPPMKQAIVGGHINLFNAGILLYRLIMAGFDCRDARVGIYSYNISVIVRKRAILQVPNLCMDCGDIEKIAQFFPCQVCQGFDGRLPNIRWAIDHCSQEGGERL